MLSHHEIANLESAGKLVITDFNKKMLRPSSYCMSAGDCIHVPDCSTIDIADSKTYPNYQTYDFTNKYEFLPSEFMLIQTYERIYMSNDLAGIVTIPSGLARLGVSMLNSILVSPGYGTNEPLSLTIELLNVSKSKIILHPRFRICHLILFQLSSTSELNYDKDFGHQSHNFVNSSFYKSWK